MLGARHARRDAVPGRAVGAGTHIASNCRPYIQSIGATLWPCRILVHYKRSTVSATGFLASFPAVSIIADIPVPPSGHYFRVVKISTYIYAHFVYQVRY